MTASRTHWVSVNSREGADVSTEWVWRVFLNHKPTGECIERFDMITPGARGWDALTDIDTALAVRGFTRSTSWEIGSGHGFVAWVDYRTPGHSSSA